VTSRTFLLITSELVEGVDRFIASRWRQAAEAGKPLCVTVSDSSRKRSNQQNHLAWSLLGQLEEGAVVNGQVYLAEAWHHMLRMRHGWVIDGPDGTKQPRSSTEMSIAQMSDYIEFIRSYAATEHDLNLE
jgi:hypothetical protein